MADSKGLGERNPRKDAGFHREWSMEVISGELAQRDAQKTRTSR